MRAKRPRVVGPRVARLIRALEPWRGAIDLRLPAPAGGGRSLTLAEKAVLLPTALRPVSLRRAAQRKDFELVVTQQSLAVLDFIRSPSPGLTRRQKLRLAEGFLKISERVPCLHRWEEIARFAVEAARTSAGDGCFVEAGAYQGGGTAKLSLVAHALRRPLVVFDTFDGLPTSATQTVGDRRVFLRAGAMRGTRRQVMANVRSYGRVRSCRFVPGPIAKTLPGLDLRVLGAFVDLDLASSVRDCLRHLYPKLAPGGFILCHDGHFLDVSTMLGRESFWLEVVGTPPPAIERSGDAGKLLLIRKEPRA